MTEREKPFPRIDGQLSCGRFEVRELGQNVYLSEIYAVMQAVRGVNYVDVESFGGVPKRVVPDNLKAAVLKALIHGQDHKLPGSAKSAVHQQAVEVAAHSRVLVAVPTEDLLNAVGGEAGF